MPETTAMPEELEFELPAQDVPLRDGEDNFASTLNLEDRRRKDSQIDELRKTLKMLEGTATGVVHSKYASSPSARRRQIGQKKKVQELNKLTFKRGDRWEGPCAPFTVINLNPVPLQLMGMLDRWTVPAAGNGEKINLTFRGRTFTGSYLTIRTAIVYQAHTGTQNDKATGIDMPAVDWNYIPPAGLVHQFYEHYVEGAADAQYMGGVIIFEGDIHALDPKRLERSEGKIWVPKKEVTLEGFGDVVYTVESYPLLDVVEKAVTMQRNYADRQIAEGHEFATSQSDIIRNQLTFYHRTWHNFALKLGYIEKALPWAVDRLTDRPTNLAVYCPDCHARQTNPEQYLCSNCNAPFDACKAYLAGKAVSPDRLVAYEEDSDEFKLILEETRRRKARIAMLELPGEGETAPTPRRRGKNKTTEL